MTFQWLLDFIVGLLVWRTLSYSATLSFWQHSLLCWLARVGEFCELWTMKVEYLNVECCAFVTWKCFLLGLLFVSSRYKYSSEAFVCAAVQADMLSGVYCHQLSFAASLNTAPVEQGGFVHVITQLGCLGAEESACFWINTPHFDFKIICFIFSNSLLSWVFKTGRFHDVLGHLKRTIMTCKPWCDLTGKASLTWQHARSCPFSWLSFVSEADKKFVSRWPCETPTSLTL